jgi:hypothetical protein
VIGLKFTVALVGKRVNEARRIALESPMIGRRWNDPSPPINESCTLYNSRRFVIKSRQADKKNERVSHRRIPERGHQGKEIVGIFYDPAKDSVQWCCRSIAGLVELPKSEFLTIRG